MIDMKKKYRTRSGLPVRVLCTDRAGFNPVVYLIMEDGGETIVSATIDGRYASFPGQENGLDLIEISPYEEFKVDDLCVVWDYDYADDVSRRKIFQYFAHSDGENAACFLSGTSYNDPKVYAWWDNCRKATSEEIKSKIVNQEI